MRKTIKYFPIFVLSLLGCVSCETTSSSTQILPPTDFNLLYKEGFTILNLTDTQIIDSSQCRTADRLDDNAKHEWRPANMNLLCFNIIDKLVNKVKPDLITLNGDNVYGSFDDAGTSLKALLDKLDSYKIPFTLTYGNHDNESNLGRTYQSNLIKSYEYSMFKDEVNFIGLYNENNELLRNIIMFDSNGCGSASIQSQKDGVFTKGYPTQKQRDTIKEMNLKVSTYAGTNVPSIVYQHIMPSDVAQALIDLDFTSKEFVPVKATQEGWFGELNEEPGGGSGKLIPLYESMHADNVMYGHDHVNNLSFPYNGIRYTYVMKSSLYDYNQTNMIGGTVQILTNNGKDVQTYHEYYSRVS